jgi:hypothetical protein
MFANVPKQIGPERQDAAQSIESNTDRPLALVAAVGVGETTSEAYDCVDQPEDDPGDEHTVRASVG